MFSLRRRGSYKSNNEENTKIGGRFTHGLSCMSATGRFDFKDKSIMKQNVWDANLSVTFSKYGINASTHFST